MRDLTGEKFGRLTVLAKSHRSEKKVWLWLCVCECGNRKLYRGPDLVSGNSRSCGCWKHDRLADLHRTHGMHGTLEYHSWFSMFARCYNPKNSRYARYGGRGIRVCQRWWDSFENFLADVGPAPGPGYSIDRFPDKDGNYEPGNVRWATAKEQAANRANYSDKLRAAWVVRKAKRACAP